jgi:hypothetical protein
MRVEQETRNLSPMFALAPRVVINMFVHKGTVAPSSFTTLHTNLNLFPMVLSQIPFGHLLESRRPRSNMVSSMSVAAHPTLETPQAVWDCWSGTLKPTKNQRKILLSELLQKPSTVSPPRKSINTTYNTETNQALLRKASSALTAVQWAGKSQKTIKVITLYCNYTHFKNPFLRSRSAMIMVPTRRKVTLS